MGIKPKIVPIVGKQSSNEFPSVKKEIFHAELFQTTQELLCKPLLMKKNAKRVVILCM